MTGPTETDELFARLEGQRLARARLEAAIEVAVQELCAEHVPFRYDDKRGTDQNAVGCRACYPGDSSWPCNSRTVANELAAQIGSGGPDA